MADTGAGLCVLHHIRRELELTTADVAVHPNNQLCRAANLLQAAHHNSPSIRAHGGRCQAHQNVRYFVQHDNVVPCIGWDEVQAVDLCNEPARRICKRAQLVVRNQDALAMKVRVQLGNKAPPACRATTEALGHR